jgi:hypothetical protein
MRRLGHWSLRAYQGFAAQLNAAVMTVAICLAVRVTTGIGIVVTMLAAIAVVIAFVVAVVMALVMDVLTAIFSSHYRDHAIIGPGWGTAAHNFHDLVWD